MRVRYDTDRTLQRQILQYKQQQLLKNYSTVLTMLSVNSNVKLTLAVSTRERESKSEIAVRV